MPDTEVGKGYVSVSVDKAGLQGELGNLGGMLGAKFGPLGQQLGTLLGGNMSKGIESQVGENAPAGKGIMSLAGLLGDAGPWGIAAGAAVASAAAIGGALYKMGSDFETQYRTLARNTGATGKDLDALETSFKTVAKSGPSSFSDVTKAIEDVQRYTGPMGGQLDVIAQRMLTLSRITGTDVASNTEAATHAMENWNISQKNAPKAMDELFTASQKSGVSFSSLAGTITRFGPPLRTMGFSFSQSAVLAAQFGKEGLNTSRIMASMQMAA